MKYFFILIMSMTIFAIFSEELIVLINDLDKSLRQVSLKHAMDTVKKQRSQPREWKSKIEYPEKAEGIGAQIKMGKYVNWKTDALQKELNDLRGQLPKRADLQGISREALNAKFDNLEKYKKALFAYHFRPDKDLRSEERFEKLFFAAQNVYKDFIEAQAEKVAADEIEKIKSKLEEIKKKVNGVLNIDNKESRLFYLKNYLNELNSIRKSYSKDFSNAKEEYIQKKQKWADRPSKELEILETKIKQFDLLETLALAIELKIKNAINELSVTKEEKKPESRLASQIEARRAAIAGEDDLSEDEDSNWLD